MRAETGTGSPTASSASTWGTSAQTPSRCPANRGSLHGPACSADACARRAPPNAGNPRGGAPRSPDGTRLQVTLRRGAAERPRRARLLSSALKTWARSRNDPRHRLNGTHEVERLPRLHPDAARRAGACIAKLSLLPGRLVDPQLLRNAPASAMRAPGLVTKLLDDFNVSRREVSARHEGEPAAGPEVDQENDKGDKFADARRGRHLVIGLRSVRRRPWQPNEN